MPTENKTEVLAQELARAIAQFRRLEPPRGSFHELKSGEFFLLATLINSIRPGTNGLKASELSAQLQVTPAAVTHVINDLEKAGYVERVSDPTDRRIVLMRPTAAGQQMMELATFQFLEALKGLVEFLGEDDSRELIRLMSSAMTYFKSIPDSLKHREE